MSCTSQRQTQKSELILDSEVDDTTEQLYQICLSDISKCETSDQVKLLSDNLKEKYHELRDLLCSLVALKSKYGRNEERQKLISTYEKVQEQYKVKLIQLNELRVSLGDVNVTELSFKVQSQLPEDEISPQEKCQSFVDDQSRCDEMSRVRVSISEDPGDSASQINPLDLYSPITGENISMPDKNVKAYMSSSNPFQSRSTIQTKNPNVAVNDHIHKPPHNEYHEKMSTPETFRNNPVSNFNEFNLGQDSHYLASSYKNEARLETFSPHFQFDQTKAHQNLPKQVTFQHHRDISQQRPFHSNDDLRHNKNPERSYLSEISQSDGFYHSKNPERTYPSNKSQSDGFYQNKNHEESYPERSYPTINKSPYIIHQNNNPERSYPINRSLQDGVYGIHHNATDRNYPRTYNQSQYNNDVEERKPHHTHADRNDPINSDINKGYRRGSVTNNVEEDNDARSLYAVGNPVTNKCTRHSKLSIDFNPFLPKNNPGHSSHGGDSFAAKFLIKQELCKVRKEDAYEGEPTKFYGFVQRIRSKISSLNLDEYDILEILSANCTGEAKNIVSHYEYSAYADGETTLDLIWKDLYKSFGHPKKVYKELDKMLGEVGNINNKEDVVKVKKLLRVCNLISVNMNHEIDSLQIYDTDPGQDKIIPLLPKDMFERWRRIVKSYNGQCPKFVRFVEFIQDVVDEVNIFSRTSSNKNVNTTLYASDMEPLPGKMPNNDRESFCFFHKSNTHQLYNCKEFKIQSEKDRDSYVRSNNLCFKCLKPHPRRFCKFKAKCSKCQGNHLTITHDCSWVKNFIDQGSKQSQNNNNDRVEDVPNMYVPSPNAPGNSEWRKENAGETSLCGISTEENEVSHTYSKVLLVEISSPVTKNSVKCYSILDEQSSRSFVSPDLIEALGVSGTDIEYSLNTMTGMKTFATGKKVSGLRIKGVNEIKSYALPIVYSNEFIPNCVAESASPDAVCSNPATKRFCKFFPPIDESLCVMALIGRDSGELMKTKCLSNIAPFVHKTNLGYAIVGSINPNDKVNNSINVVKTMEHFDSQLCVPINKNKEHDVDYKDSLLRLPDDELPGKSQDDIKFDNIMDSRTNITDKNYIVVPLPFKNEDVMFPDNRKAVYVRTKNTLQRLSKDSDKLEQCCSTMQKYLKAGHVEPVPYDQLNPQEGKAWWIPVIHVAQARKKSRIVFDASASYGKTSLNDQLLQGPDRNNNLRGVLMRFRNGPVAVSADVEAMFHNFYLPKSDRDYVRFYWFEDNNPNSKLVQFRACVQIFGNKSSPAVANHGLRFAINSPSDNDCSQASKSLIVNNIYVDDVLAAFDCEEEAKNVLEGSINKLSQFNIRLHKVASNSEHIIKSFPSSEISECYSNEKEVVCGALGMLWDVNHDKFKFEIDLPEKDFTPRGILSTNHAIFDPLGFLSPIILQGRLLQRELFESRQGTPKGVAVDWDKPFSSENKHRWDNWKNSLSDINKINFPRSYYPQNLTPIEKRELHVFSDASLDGLGYCIYLRSFGQGKTHIAMVCAGSKLTPRAATSMPRLELCGALEASSAALRVKQELQVSSDNVFYYSDSRVVLGYLQNSEKRFTRYVSRRIEMIKNMCGNASWFYVSTEVNPADQASRPASVEALINSKWFCGPDFLWNVDFYPAQNMSNISVEELPEASSITVENVLKTNAENHAAHIFDQVIDKAGTLTKLIKIASRVISMSNCLDRARQRLGISLAPRPPFDEVSEKYSLNVLINCSQKKYQNKMSTISNLSPFVDSSGIIRVGGRLRHSFIPFDGKHPVILPRSSSLARLIVIHYHSNVKHSGRTISLAALRSAGFFIEGGRNLVNFVIKACVICQRLRGQPSVPKMADLPLDRLEECPVFTFSGCDIFGPYSVTEGKSTRRNAPTKKVWGLVFICMVTRAIHVESVGGLDTSSFRNALRRFFALRGVCRHMRSDNGSNFVAALKQMESAKSFQELQLEAAKMSCEWHFNPPAASHFGGSWERAIGSIRKIMNASILLLGDRAIMRDELDTLFKEASAIINNTPLYQVSYHPEEPLPISPANLMTLKDAPNPPPIETFTKSDMDSYAKLRWKRVQHLAEEFWHRWRKHYIVELQSRSKWTKDRPNMIPGNVVLIKEKNLPRNEWRTAIIQQVFPSDDGVVRSCDVRTSKGIYRRAVSDLVLLISVEVGMSRQNSDTPDEIN